MHIDASGSLAGWGWTPRRSQQGRFSIVDASRIVRHTAGFSLRTAFVEGVSYLNGWGYRLPASKIKVRYLPRILLTDTVRLLLLASISVGISSAVNIARKQPIPWKYRPPAQRLDEAVQVLLPVIEGTPVAHKIFEEVGLEEFQALVLSGKSTVIDARAGAFYKLGHVPTALSLPRETFASDYDRLKIRLEASRAGEIIVYCSEPDCPDADLVAGALSRLGFQRLRIYKEGWEEWTRAGLPREKAVTP